MKIFLCMILMLTGWRTAVAAEPAPAFENMAYGEDVRNVLDLWVAEGDSPRPLLIYIHGGAWTSNDKSQIIGRVNITNWLAKGVSVASISYRYSTTDILPAPVLDAARAIQFLRYKAAELNIDPSRIALQGGSAGACSSLWIAFHDDLADPSASDPVLRESSRVQGAYAGSAQTTIDPKVINDWIGPLAASHSMIYRAVGASSYDDMMSNYDRYKLLIDEFSPINHMDPQDPPVFLTCPADMTVPPPNSSTAIHHGMFGVKLKEKADEIGYSKCSLSIAGTAVPEHFSHQDLFLEAVLLGKE
jgi:acetyl esterase/lipase